MNPTAALGTMLPAGTLAAAVLYMAVAVSMGHGPLFRLPATLDVAQSEIDACERRGSRSHDACVGEAEGKALIRRAEWVAAVEEGRRAAVEMDATRAGPRVIVVRPPSGLPQ